MGCRGERKLGRWLLSTVRGAVLHLLGGSFQTLGTDPAQGGIHKLQGPQSFLPSQSEHLVGTSCVLGSATGGGV